MVTSAKLAIAKALKWLLKGIILSAKKYAGKFSKKAFFVAVILFAIYVSGFLIPCPFRLLNTFLFAEQTQSIAFLRYLPVFIPFFEILTFMHIWITGVAVWYHFKVFLKKGGFI